MDAQLGWRSLHWRSVHFLGPDASFSPRAEHRGSRVSELGLKLGDAVELVKQELCRAALGRVIDPLVRNFAPCKRMPSWAYSKTVPSPWGICL